MHAFFSVLSGDCTGDRLPLTADGENLIGRGADCQLTLPDPICSRVHACVVQQEDGWWVRDAGSRNGTLVNGQKVEAAALDEGHTVKVGSTELEFHLSEEPLTAEDDAPSATQTIVQNVEMTESALAEASITGLPNTEQVKELMLLYQLCIRLLGSGKSAEVIDASLDLLQKRTGASVVGFLWLNEEGELKPKIVLPADAGDRVTLSPSLTKLVSAQGQAVWVANQGDSAAADRPEKFADAVCAPLMDRDAQGERITLGAIHVYRDAGRFRQSDFDFIISVANLVSTALTRAIAYSAMQVDYERLVRASPGHDELIGESDPMQKLKSKITRVAKAAGCVLLRGESGAGKEVVARAIHRASPRASQPMVAVNCAAIPAELIESQLFGHKAGSFTGADRDHTGYFQQADLGTLFLDEVGELTLEGQAKLLRVMEGHPFLPVGATEQVTVDVRVIAATNQDLQQYVREKRFREDLYYRLSVFELHLPPLRDRGEDLSLLVDFFLDHYRMTHGRPDLRLGPAALKKLLAYHWPGNVRQLRNVIDSAVVMAESNEIEPTDLALRDSGREDLDTLEIEHWERKLIVEALGRSSGSVPAAAKLLGISRATLYRKIEHHHIER